MTTQKENPAGHGASKLIHHDFRQSQLSNLHRYSQATRIEILEHHTLKAHRCWLEAPSKCNLYRAGLLWIAFKSEFNGAAN